MSVWLSASSARASSTLQLGDLAVEDLRGPLQLTLPLQPVSLGSQLVDLLPQVTDLVEALLLGLPPRLEPAQLLLGVGELAVQPAQPLDGAAVGLLLQGEPLHLHPVHGPAELIDLLRGRVDLHPQPRRGLVDQVDGLVGKLTRRDVAVRQRRGRDQSPVGDGHLVVRLVPLSQSAQDRDRVLDTRLADVDLLEPPLQGGVLLDPFPVLVQGGGADHPQLTAGQHRLQHVARVHRGVTGRAGADHRVQLVDEGDHLALGVPDLRQHRLQPLLELTAVLRTGDHRGQIQRNQPATLQGVRHVTGDQALGQSLDDGRLADAGLTDQHRVVLGPAGQHLHHPADLGVAADDGIQPALAGLLGQVDAVLVEGRGGSLGLLAGHPLGSARGVERGRQTVGRHVQVGEDLLRVGGDGGQGDQQVLGGHVAVAELFGAGLRVGEHPGEGTGQGGLADRRAAGRRQLGDRALSGGVDHRRVGSDGGQQRSDGVARHHQQGVQQMRRLSTRVAGRQRVAQRR